MWTVETLPGSASVTLPAVPSGVDGAALLGGAPRARLISMQERPEYAGMAWAVGSGSRPLVRSCTP